MPTATRPAARRAPPRVVSAVGTLARGGRRLVSGDRPFAVVLIGAVVLSVMMASGPAQRYLDGRARVDALAAKADVLEQENARLGERARDLNDPTNIELLAREQLGFVRPGEVPYTLVPPEVERPRITEPRHDPDPEPSGWLERAWSTLGRWFGG